MMRRLSCAIVGLSLLATVASAQQRGEPYGGPAISIASDGTLVVQGAAEVPPYSPAGRWTEGRPASSTRDAVRVFRFLGSGGPPAIEVYVHTSFTGASDGVFENGLVQGFVTSFSAGAGFAPGPLAVEDATLGGMPVKRCHAELTKAGRKLWLDAWIFVRSPSLTFLALRPRPDARGEIEAYLQSVRFE